MTLCIKLCTFLMHLQSSSTFSDTLHIRLHMLCNSPPPPASVMTWSPGDEMALQAGRLGLSHWAGPSVTRSASESQGSNRGIIVVILAKGREVPLAWEFMYMTEEVI